MKITALSKLYGLTFYYIFLQILTTNGIKYDLLLYNEGTYTWEFILLLCSPRALLI